jgi:acyl-coenzyme A thioesterase PaaI-like protein
MKAPFIRNPGIFRRFMNLWPPFLGAGIKVREISNDFTSVRVDLVSRPWNANVNGSQYGGSIFSMTDPFYALMLIHNLGNDYTVWDKAADIKFKTPGTGTLSATFNISKERIAEIRAEADARGRANPQFSAQVRDKAGTLVAEVSKTVHVRRKEPANGG